MFFFNRPPPPDSAKLLDDLDAARSAERLDLVSKLYPSLVATVKQTATPLSPARRAKVQRVMAFVARANRISLLQRMFSDLPDLGFAQTHTDHSVLLLGFARAGKAARALSWAEGMEATYGIAPSVKDWNVVLGGFRREGDMEGMRTVLRRMTQNGCPPDVISYNNLLSALFEQGRVHEARGVRDEMEASGVEADVWTETTLLSGFVEASELASAAEVQRRLAPVVAAWEKDRPEDFDLAAVNAIAKFACATEGFSSGVGLVEGYRDRGHALNEITLDTLAKEGARGLATAEEGIKLLEDLEESTGVRAGRKAWSITIAGVLAGPGGTDEALKVLQEARDRSVKPDSTMIQPLLSALLSTPSTESFAIAKELYEDLAASSRAYSTAPDSSIFITLLRACAHPTLHDLEFSHTLLADMRERDVRLDPQTVTWHIVALMRVARDFADAFQAYDKVRALDASILDTQAYNIILSAFTSLFFPPSPSSPDPDAHIAPPALILEFLSDMRRTSHPPDAVTYSLLLTYYSRTASASVSLVSHLHSLIKLDTNVDPDTALFNSLMGAYSRVGAFQTAFRIWDSMRANGDVDSTSVSIVLDTCGFARDPKRARRTWEELRRERFELNRKNWDSWVECLCRLGDFDEAERVVFEEMREGGAARGVVAGVSTLETLIKLSRREKGLRWEEVRERVRTERPDLWDAVKDVAVNEGAQGLELEEADAAATSPKDGGGALLSRF